MNFTTAQQIVYGAVLMGDYASECQSIEDKRATRRDRINKRANELHEKLWREIPSGEVGKTLRLAGNEEELYSALAKCVREGSRQGAANFLWTWIDNDLWDRANVQATKEIDGDL